jgi:glycosyltransferase involved in cell wall biosynthesis
MTVRVLIAHNRYRSEMPSGENRVVDDDVAALTAAGVEVETFFRESDSIAALGPMARASLAVSPTYSAEAVREFKKRLDEFRPDVVHLHNPVPLISPWIVRTAAKAGVPVVQTIHNYRHACPSSTSLFRDGRICEDCVGKSFPWPGVVHGCYRGSRAQSLSMAVSARVHRSTWQLVDRYLPVSEFVGHYLTLAGIPADRITVRPNSTARRGPVKPPGSGFLFVGRLTAEKGVSLLLSAWEKAAVWDEHRLVVAGDGPERELVLAAAGRNVDYRGVVDQDGVARLLDETSVVVIPSLCYEGFPRLLAESLERGRPVAATALGSLKDWVTPEVGWTAGTTPAAFAEMLARVAADTTIAAKSAAARRFFEAHLTPEGALEQLLDVYRQVTSSVAVPMARGKALPG